MPEFIYLPSRPDKFKLGYRNMCNFWFCNFWKYLKEYDKILRIDEDCYYYSDYNKVFKLLNNKVFVYGGRTGDKDFVTKGLNNFTLDFMKQNNIKNIYRRSPSGPLTHVIGINLDRCRKNTLLTKYISSIKTSNNIYVYRWGDLPLWGESIEYFFENKDRLSTSKIQYYHESHKARINC